MKRLLPAKAQEWPEAEAERAADTRRGTRLVDLGPEDMDRRIAAAGESEIAHHQLTEEESQSVVVKMD